MSGQFARFNLIGESEPFLQAVGLIGKIAASDATALILGETGTGKELVARAIHYLSARRDYPFIPVNCGAMAESLVENELFGHDRGAFTDARESRPGLVAQAEGGTLFLDEVDALSPKAQVSLLRFLQDLRYRPVGSRSEARADVRVLAATNGDLEREVKLGHFRQDLLYRLDVLALALPPLRERGDDVQLLADHFLRIYNAQDGTTTRRLSAAGRAWMRRYAWPGNVRELENQLRRACLMASGPEIDLPARCAAGPGGSEEESASAPDDFNAAKARAIEAFERGFLLRMLAETGGNVSLAARRCGKERRAFGKLLKKHGIDKSAFLSPS